MCAQDFRWKTLVLFDVSFLRWLLFFCAGIDFTSCPAFSGSKSPGSLGILCACFRMAVETKEEEKPEIDADPLDQLTAYFETVDPQHFPSCLANPLFGSMSCF